MTDSLTVADVQAMLDASPFIRGCGMRVAHLDAEALEIAVELAMRPEFERRAGTGQWHGGPKSMGCIRRQRTRRPTHSRLRM